MTIPLGYSSITYDDDAVLEAIADVAACRYEGYELSLPELRATGVETVREALDTHDLELYSVIGEWLESEAAVERVAEGMSLAAAVDAHTVTILPPRRGLQDDATVHEWFERLCTAAADAGVQPVLHHHGGTHVESGDETAAWLDAHDMELLFDTAHYYPYGDPVAGLERFADRIGYVHLKDIDPPTGFEGFTEDLTAANFNLDSVINYFRAFTDLGEGVIDFGAVAETIAETGVGPVTIEIENRIHDPLVHAKRNRDHFRAVAD